MEAKAVLFDCFGVLATVSPDRFFEKFLSDKPETVKDIKDLDNRVPEGGISHQEYIEHVARASGYDQETVEQYTGKDSQNTELFDFIASTLKPQYKIGFLSNAPGDWTESLFTKEQLDLFDDFVFSYQTGVRKPNPEIFKLAAGRLGISTDKCIMVDDVQVYLDGAKEAGMQAILYTGFDSFKQEIEKILAG